MAVPPESQFDPATTGFCWINTIWGEVSELAAKLISSRDNMAGALAGVKHSGIVTTCGVTSRKENPGDARVPISAAKLADTEMDDLLESSGATTFFTLVRYNMPEPLEDYVRENEDVLSTSTSKGNSKKKKILSSMSSSASASSISESSEGKDEETPEEIIFMLFGPRVWEHGGILVCEQLLYVNFINLQAKIGCEASLQSRPQEKT